MARTPPIATSETLRVEVFDAASSSGGTIRLIAQTSPVGSNLLWMIPPNCCSARDKSRVPKP
jgi:hypothetical protein